MEEYLKEIANELKLIRLELEQLNGERIFKDGPKVNMKALARNLDNMQRTSAARKSF